MATDIVQSLFGMTPDSYQQAQQDRANTQAMQFAKLDPFQQANYSIGRGAYGLAGAVGGALGGQDPELQRITMRQQIAGQIDYNDDASIRNAMSKLRDDPQAMLQLQKILVDQQVKRASIGKDDAAAKASLATESKINLGVAQENKLRDELSKLPPGSTEDAIRGVLVKYGDPDKVLAALKPKSNDAMLMEQLGYPLTQKGYQDFRDAQRQERMLSPEEENQKIRIANASRPPAQPRAEQPLVAIVGPDGNPILVSRENAVNRTPANTVEKPMTEAQRIKYTKGKVSDRDVVTGAFAVTGELEKLTDELVGNPDKKIAPALGLNSITGFSALTNPLALPSGDARKALQKLETFKGKIMALGRQLASQEGKLGNMAVQEWKFVSDAVQKIDPAAGNLDEQMRDVVRQANAYAKRQQSKYEDNYADDRATPSAASPAPAANVITNPKFPGFSIGK